MIFPEPVIFFTATIHQWKPLLNSDQFKEVIVSSLRYLSEKERIIVFSFVIMPNHIHLIVKLLENETITESAMGSLLKYTAHEFKKSLMTHGSRLLYHYKVDEKDRNFRFWNDSTHMFEIYTDEMFTQKADYIHNNPVSGKWSLVDHPLNYYYSSMKFYEVNENSFGFLHNYYCEQ